jgi:ADP-ribosyl-[dinitrogen reductase] hydrolase
LIGLAIGDAVGTTLEFSDRDANPPLTDMVGGGPFALEAGQWTDDTAMALALGSSLLCCDGVDEADLMARFWSWFDAGDYSCTGTCFDIGITTRVALMDWKRGGNPIAGSTDPMSAGNGSVMRLAPVAIRYWNSRAQLLDAAARQSRTTHGAWEAVCACQFYAGLLADVIADGRGLEAVSPEAGSGLAPAIADIAAGSWRGKPRQAISSTGYVVHTLEASLWCVDQTTSFEDAVLMAANLGVDADTVGAVTGQLAGALYGASGIPARWRDKLAWSQRIEEMANELFDASLAR